MPPFRRELTTLARWRDSMRAPGALPSIPTRKDLSGVARAVSRKPLLGRQPNP